VRVLSKLIPARSLFWLILFYLLFYMATGAYGTFLPVYFKDQGFSQTAIGALLALGPLVALLAQPLWGFATDRAKAMNTILKLLLAGSACAVILYRLDSGFLYLCIVMAIFTFFSTPISSVTDTITLEHINEKGWKFGPIRMAGTVGYSIVAVITGFLTRQNVNVIFLLYFCIISLAFLVSWKLPLVKGHQVKGSRASLRAIFARRELLLLLALSFVFSITMGFNSSFFAVYFRGLGADNSLLGWVFFLTGVSEIPFLLFAHRVVEKLGIKRTMMLSFLMAALRWLLLFFITDIHAILLVSLLHGTNFIVFNYCMATYISVNIPKELRATGQSVISWLNFGIAKILSSFLGGFLADQMGIQRIYFFMFLISIVTIAVFGFLFARMREETVQIAA
jgi:MFS transporter, PPP family, 3-phenylpropionic acid transporter